jgi:hypothetical protein
MFTNKIGQAAISLNKMKVLNGDDSIKEVQG